MDFPLFTVAALAALLAGFTQSFAGFGSTLVAMPLLGLALGVRAAVPLGCLMALAINILLVARLGRQAHVRGLALLLAAAAPGMVLGRAALAQAPEVLLKVLLGSVVALLALRLGRASGTGPRLGRGWGMAAGLLSGCMGVSLGINGPPVVGWAASQPWPRETLKATLAAYFLCAGLLIVAAQWLGGLVTGQVLELFGCALPFLLAGVALGLVSCGRVGEASFRRIVAGLLAASGLMLLWQAAAA